MFALLAMAGDLGGAFGPWLVGFTSQLRNDDLKAGMLVACVFPAVLIASIIVIRLKTKKQ